MCNWSSRRREEKKMGQKKYLRRTTNSKQDKHKANQYLGLTVKVLKSNDKNKNNNKKNPFESSKIK